MAEAIDFENTSGIVPRSDFIPERSPWVRVLPADWNTTLVDEISVDVFAKVVLTKVENWSITVTVLAFIAENAAIIAFDPIKIPTEPAETAIAA